MVVGEEVMAAIISQHLLSTELNQVEAENERLQTPADDAQVLMRMSMNAANEETLADCKHLEVTLQAVRCEHTAADGHTMGDCEYNAANGVNDGSAMNHVYAQDGTHTQSTGLGRCRDLNGAHFGMGAEASPEKCAELCALQDM